MRSISRLLVIALAAFPFAARAQDRFEIQVYDAETAPAGAVGLEFHFNTVAVGTVDVSAEGELPTNHVTHLTLEPHLGLARWCELGAYLQGALREDGHIDYAGLKLRFKTRIPRRFAHGIIGLGLNVELSVVPATYEANVYGSELRPIIDFRWKRLYFSINPIIGIDLAGKLAGRPQLDPAVKLAVSIVPWASLGIEYYAAFGPVTGFYAAREQSHRFFAVADLTRHLSEKLEFAANLGIGYNVVDTGDRWVAKMILGVGY